MTNKKLNYITYFQFRIIGCPENIFPELNVEEKSGFYCFEAFSSIVTTILNER